MQGELLDLPADAFFEHAPVSLWLEDYSGVKALFDQWREQGVSDIRAHLRDRPHLVAECMSRIEVLKVNRRTLELFEAESFEDLVANLDTVFTADSLDATTDDMVAIWEGGERFSSVTVNRTLTGRSLDVLLNASILPGYETSWERVLVSLEDITHRVRAERALELSEQYARGLFHHSPISLWVEDFRAVKELLDGVRASGVTDFETFIDVHPEFVDRCLAEIRVIDVNRQTVSLFGAADKEQLLRSLSQVFREDTHRHFGAQLVELWNGRLFHARETVNYSLSDERIDVYMQLSVFPGHEQDWDLVLVSLTDISARKKAEAYLEYLGKHDTLTKLHNRSFFADETSRLERRGPWPVSVIMLDLDGLKTTNDDGGHAAGDALLRRAGEVLAKAIDTGQSAIRIGGDEFCLLLPATGEQGAQAMVDRLRELVEMNNQFYGNVELRFSVGSATAYKGENLESVIHQADKAMYADKRSNRREAEGR